MALINLKLTTLCLLFTSLLMSCSPTTVTTSSETYKPGTNKTKLNLWLPGPNQSWQIQYSGEINLDVDAAIYNLDLFETTPEMIDSLHSMDRKVVCYLNAGAWEDWRPDRGDFPEELLGNRYEGWPGEYWLDIRRIDLLALPMTTRLDLCVQKGFDGVEPDNLDGYANNTGFPITSEDQITYNRWFAEQAHARNLAVGLKNDPDQIETLVPYFDWITTESCFHEGWCQQVTPFIEAGKPVIAIEYTNDPSEIDAICHLPLANKIEIIFKYLQLQAWRRTCP